MNTFSEEMCAAEFSYFMEMVVKMLFSALFFLVGTYAKLLVPRIKNQNISNLLN